MRNANLAILSNDASSKNTLNQALINSTDKKLIPEIYDEKIRKENMEEQEDPEEEEEEVVITIEQFNERVDKILSKLAEFLLSNKKTVKEFFCNYISIHNVTTYDYYDAIPLKDFIQVLQNIGIRLDTIDIYCIFTKLKYNDDFETIDVSKLLDEMLNYGIFEDNFKGFCNPILENQEENKEITEPSILEKNINNEHKSNNNFEINKNIDNNFNLISNNNELQNEFLVNINNYLKLKNISFDQFISEKSGSIKNIYEGRKIKKLIKYEELLKFCKDCQVINQFYELDNNMKEIVCENENEIEYINLQKVLNLLDKMEKEFEDFDYEVDDNFIDISNKDIDINNYTKNNNTQRTQDNKVHDDKSENYSNNQKLYKNEENEKNKNNLENFLFNEKADIINNTKISDNLKKEYSKNKNISQSRSIYSNNISLQKSSIEISRYSIHTKDKQNEASIEISKTSLPNKKYIHNDHSLKKLEKSDKSINSSLDFENIQDMEVEGLD